MEIQEGAAPAGDCVCHISAEVCSESGMLAGEFCPEELRVARTFISPEREYIELSPGYVTTDYVVVPARVIEAEDEIYTLHHLNAQGPCTLHDENTPQLPPDETGEEGDPNSDIPDWLFPNTTPPVPPEQSGNTGSPDEPQDPGEPDEPDTADPGSDQQRPSWLDPPPPEVEPGEPDEPTPPPEE